MVLCALCGLACQSPAPTGSTGGSVTTSGAPVLAPSRPGARLSAALPFDARQVVSQVRHAWTKDREARDPRYQASLAGGALRVLPGGLRGGEVLRAGRPLELATTRVSLGQRELYRAGAATAAPAFRASGARAERELTPTLREAIEAGDGRLEQRWLFERLPARGELVIELTVSGMPWAGEREGVHLFRAGRGLGVSYGKATARDADGRAVTVAAERTASGLRVRVPARFIAQARPPLLVDPLIGAELAMDTALPRATAEDQTVPRVATSGAEYLVVWQDTRVLDGRSHVYGARVSQAGALVDATGLELSSTANSQSAPDVAWGGTSYLVVWEETGTLPATVGYDIYGTRVDPTSGAVLDAGGIKINGGAGNQNAPRVRYGGSQFLVVWHWSGTGSTGYDIAGARVSTAGTVLDTTALVVSNATGNQQYPTLEANGSTFLVAWDDLRNTATSSNDIYAARVNSGGNVLDATGIAVTTAAETQRYPAVSSNGSDWLIAWEDRRNYSITWTDVYGARVSTAGTVLDAAGIAISALGGDELKPHLASDGADYLVIWDDGTVIPGNVGGRWVKASGSTPDPGFQVVVTTQTDLVYNSTSKHFFIPRYGSGLSNDVFARRVLGTGAAVDTTDVTVSMAYNAQYYPAAAYDGTNYLLVWSDSRNWASTGWDIYGARVSTTGTLLDASGILICNAGGTQSYPDVGFDGTNYMVVWEDRRPGSSVADVFGGRLTKAGALLDNQGFQLTGQVYEQRFPRLAFDNLGTYLVVWQDHRNSSSNGTDIYGTRVRASDGFVYEQLSGIPISTQTASETEPAVAFDGNTFAVVWSDGRTSASAPDIYGARVNLSGQVLDPTGKAISTAASSQLSPDITFTGAQYLVAWQDSRTSANGYDLYGTYLSDLLVPGSASGFVIYAGAGDQSRPRVRVIGKAPTVVWEDRLSFDTAYYNLRGARLGGTAVLETFVLSADPRNELRPVLAAGSGAAGITAYMHYDTALKTIRVVGRTFLENCTSSSQCPPGTTCSGGKCVPCTTSAACGPTCVACSSGSFCDGVSCKTCNTSAHCGSSCVACGGGTPLCNGTACVECLGPGDCAFGKVCQSFVCVLPPDLGPPDLGAPDLKKPDLAVPDKGPALEGGSQEGGSQEAGSKDAAAKDAAAKDVATADQGQAQDAPATDLASDGPRSEAGADRGAGEGAPPSSSSGCNCRVGEGPRAGGSLPLLALLAALALFLRRRR